MSLPRKSSAILEAGDAKINDKMTVNLFCGLSQHNSQNQQQANYEKLSLGFDHLKLG